MPAVKNASPKRRLRKRSALALVLLVAMFCFGFYKLHTPYAFRDATDALIQEHRAEFDTWEYLDARPVAMTQAQIDRERALVGMMVKQLEDVRPLPVQSAGGYGPGNSRSARVNCMSCWSLSMRSSPIHALWRCTC